MNHPAASGRGIAVDVNFYIAASGRGIAVDVNFYIAASGGE